MGKDFIMLVIFGVVVLVAGIYYLYTKSKSKNPNKGTEVQGTNEETALQGVKRPEKQVEQKDMSGFIKFDKIANDMIYQNNGERYTMVVQCKGINYNLMSEIEQMAVEEAFIMFLNTLKFPIQLYVQTRSIDLSDNVRAYKERVKEFVDKSNEVTAKYNEIEDDVDSTQDEIDYMKKEKVKYANIAEYTSDITRYVERMALNKYMLQRNFYIVFSYNKSEIATTEKFTKEEYEDLCYRELYTRAQGIIGSLISCSVNCKILTSNELAQLVYVSLNKDDANTMNIKDALDSGMFRLYTSSEDVIKKKREMIEEELNKQGMQRVEEAVQQAIAKGLIVTEAESDEAVQKEIDRRALKIIDKSNADENIKKELKNTIKENRKKRVEALNEKLAKQEEKVEAETPAQEEKVEIPTEEVMGQDDLIVTKPAEQNDDELVIGTTDVGSNEQKEGEKTDEE